MKERSIDKPVVIAVEGLDYLYFLLSQIKHKKEFADVQLWDYKAGKYDVEQGIEALLEQSAFKKEEVRSLGIICDAEESRSKSEKAIHRTLTRNKLPTPATQLTVARGLPAVAYLIMPHNQATGCVENACLQSSTLTPDHVQCGERFLEMVLPHFGKGFNDNWKAKVKVHALIAGSGRNPALTLGQSAEAALWNFQNESIRVMLDLIETVRDHQ